jgi:diguanylate cyclase (GGDEF)-like protein
MAALHDGKPAEAMSSIHHRSGYWTPVHIWAIPLRDKHASIIGIIQTFQSEFAVQSPSPNDRSMKEHGCLDYATELPNRALMQSHLRERLVAFTELHIPFGVVCVEVHQLLQLHARYGQEAAASMLRVLARTLRNTIWPADFVGRWSEDRFLVILSGCHEEALQAVSQRILKMTGRATIEWWGEELSVAVLIGSTEALECDDVESLLRRAQESLKQNRSETSRAAAGSLSSIG